MAAPVSYLWYFGDGRISTEKRPHHTYLMAGVYTIVVYVTDTNGVVWETRTTVYVTDWDLTGADNGPHVAFSTQCYVAALKPLQGRGIVPWGGEHWLWPEAYVGTCKGFDAGNQAMSLILNNRNGRFYRVGLPEQWIDREDSYGGHEILCRLRLKEHVALAGEHETVDFTEGHYHLRPYDENYRNQAGYDTAGFRNQFRIDASIFIDGEQKQSYDTVRKGNQYGEYIYGKHVSARRLQTELVMYTSAWRLVRAQEMINNLDIKAGPHYDVPAESEWQREYSTPDLWISRSRIAPIRNRATGSDVAGTYATQTTGPDGKALSGISFNAGQGLTTTLPMIQVVNSTFMFWVSAMLTTGTVLQFATDAGTLVSEIVLAAGVYYLRVTIGAWTQDYPLDGWTGITWAQVAVAIAPAYVRIYHNGMQIDATATPALGMYGGNTVIVAGGAFDLFDIRRVPRSISADAINYYYGDVLAGGDGGMLPHMK